jgi:hypothetical protein
VIETFQTFNTSIGYRGGIDRRGAQDLSGTTAIFGGAKATTETPATLPKPISQPIGGIESCCGDFSGEGLFFFGLFISLFQRGDECTRDDATPGGVASFSRV